MTGRDGGFLDRWARLKRAAERADTTPAPEDAAGPAPEPLPEAGPEPEADPELLASLPRLEDITATTDIKVFLQKGVPAALRNAALRRAWSADPIISTYEDPARDYFWDWNAPGGVPGGGGTLNPDRVARMVRDLVGNDESQTDDSRPEAPAEAPPPADRPDAAPAAEDVAAEAEPPAPLAEARAPAPTPVAPPENLDPAAPPRRRHGGAVPG